MLLSLLLMGCGTPTEREVSSKARVVPKGGEVWGRDLARGLGLLPWELCRELGTVDCIRDAHRITLGGMEPEGLGIDAPLANALVTAPIAADRVALSACGERFVRDRAGDPILFGPVLEDDSPTARKEVATQLVQRLLSRAPNRDELKALESLHDDLDGVSSDLVRDWSVGACTVVATSTEALFY